MSGILPSTLRVSLRLFKIAPRDFVEPLDFIAPLAALVPKPRVNLTRFHWVFAPNTKRSEPVGGASAEGPLRSILDLSRVWVFSTGVCTCRSPLAECGPI